MNNTRYQNTVKIVSALQKLQCPVCGHSPIVRITGESEFKIYGTCHKELDVLIEQTKNSFLDPRFRHSETEGESESPLC